MSVKMVQRVYRLGKKLTKPNEQAVLVALAFILHDDKNLCYPKRETLMQMTHLSNGALTTALNKLRENGLLTWVSGGLANKKGKNGKTLSNAYTFTLPPETAVGKAGKSQPSGQQQGTPVDITCPHQSPADGHTSGQQVSTAVASTCPPKNNNNKDNNKDDAVKTPDTASDLNNLANNLGSAFTAKRTVQTPKDIEASPIRRALRLCNLTPNDPGYGDNFRIFSSVMSRIEEKYPGRSMEVIITLESAQRQHELDGINHMPRFITSRLNAVLEST